MIIQHALFNSLTQQITQNTNTNTNINVTNNIQNGTNVDISSDSNTVTHVDASTDVPINTDTNINTSDNMNNNAIENVKNSSYTIDKDKKTNENNKTMNDDHNNELDTDYLISLVLQQEEAVNNHSHKIKYSNEKHTKVNTINSLNVINVDDYNHINNDNDNDDNDDEIILTKSTKYFDNLSSNHVFTCGTSLRHDKNIWNKKHVERLNEYETFGNLDENDIHFNNQSYNSFRTALDRKGIKKFDKTL